jgi:hypothetical protein
MSVLTRIKNNQITDATIWANAKIIPGSIVGSLFNSNITVTSDFTITGNLTVQGSSTYLTVASTNTYVNDPLIVLNNAFAGSNSYDLGFIFNRGSDPNKAFYWDESSDEFRLITTTETGTTYGSIPAETNFENLRLGNIYLNNYTSTRALFVGASGLVTTDAEYTYDSTNDTLTVGKFIIVGNSAVTIQTTGTNQDLKLAPSGSGIVDFNGTNATNLADPLSASDAVTLGYIQSTSSSAITNIGADDSQIIIVDDGTNAGQINANVDATSVLVIKSNSLSVFGSGYTGSSPKVFVDAANSNVGIISTLFVSDDLTTGAGSLVKVNDTTDASSVSDGGAVTIKGGTAIAKKLYVGGIAEFDANVVINGNLIVNGNVTYFNSNNISFNDALIYLADDNPADILDIGIVSAFTNGASFYQHTGFVRDASDGVWKLFANVVPEPTTIVNFTDANYSTLKVGNLTAVSDITGASLNVTGNVSTAELNTGTIKATGFINTLGNVSASRLIAETLSTRAGYGNIHLTQYASVFAEGNDNQNQSLFQGTTNGLSDGVGIWAFTGSPSTVYSSRGISFLTGTTVRARDVPTGGVRNVSINSGGHLFANVTTDTSSLTTGAIVAAGGAAVGKTLWVGEGAVINSTQAAEAFHVLGQGTSNSLIYADFAKNAIVFGGANVLVQDGVVAKFNSDGAIILPVGSSARRPGAAGNVDVAGMLRYSTTSNNVEFYDGSNWTAAGSQFTVITTNAFNGNGVQTAFTLSSSSTTAGTIVMVNGVVQIPVTAYSVSGTTLTFTEAPATGDVVDARALITTAVVSSISSGNGYNTFDVATTPYANITAGTSSATVRVSVDGVSGRVTFTNDVTINGSLTVLGDSNGNINIGNEPGDRLQLRGKTVYDQTAINVPDANLKELDSFSVNAFTTARYTVQVVNGGGVSAAELLVSHDDATSNIATYAVLSTIPGTFQSNISSGTVRLFYTPTASQNANIKVLTTYIV